MERYGMVESWTKGCMASPRALDCLLYARMMNYYAPMTMEYYIFIDRDSTKWCMYIKNLSHVCKLQRYFHGELDARKGVNGQRLRSVHQEERKHERKRRND
ncbi:hypothetical protein Ancab_000395 [Ancistrocladus abbreviatus]